MPQKRKQKGGKRHQKGGGSSDWSHSFHANTAIGGPAAISHHTLQHINQAPMFNPLSDNAIIPTQATGITPNCLYLAQSKVAGLAGPTMVQSGGAFHTLHAPSRSANMPTLNQVAGGSNLQIVNPETGRKVQAGGRVGRRLMQTGGFSQVVNPETGRKVSVSTQQGGQILHQAGAL